ncbi:hypothetical protein LOTGIDRAFT_229275 [Lottia gigantea]|uniref:Calcium channel flower n=1 Tax=Lottia gigantea TaxID=225164 RepID=V4A1E6_LOTGI|nr:hypothetical protein LOTGIDRAFT_229275 [Lottia gigantea]ESO87116.1 hypothetical protein LOTGIDRAFT_229275 [Lottia gigantea]
MKRVFNRENFCWSFLVWTCRIWGILTALGLWGSGSEAVHFKHNLGIYLLIIAIIVSVLELLFIGEYCTEFAVEDSICIKFYEKLSLLDDWKKGIFYCLFAVPCFLDPSKVILGVISGVMLAFCGILYMFKTFKTRREEKLKDGEDKATYDRFEEIHDDIEDSIVNPTATLNLPGITEMPEDTYEL